MLLAGLALLGATLAPVGPVGGAAHARQDEGFDAGGGFAPGGTRLPTMDVSRYDSPETVQQGLDDLRTVDPGHYRADLPADGDQARIAGIRKSAGTSLWVTMSARLPADEEYADDISLAVGTRSGAECANTEVSVGNEDAIFTGPVPMGVLVDPATVSDDEDRRECLGAETLFVRLVHEPDEGHELPVELTVIEEPSVAGTDGLPEEADDEDFEPSWGAGKRATRTRGTRSFEDAPVLRPGRYADAVRTGGTRLYRVDADWGQHVQATLNLSPLSTGEAAQMDDEGLTVNMVIFGPSRQPVAGGEESVSAESEMVLGARTPTVRYRNREASDSSIVGTAVAGPYYVLVTTPTSADVPDLEVSYELDVRLPGTRSGAPTYDGPGAPPDGKLITADGTEQPKDAEPEQSKTRAGSTSWWPILGPVSVGLLAAALALAVGLLLRHRGSR